MQFRVPLRNLEWGGLQVQNLEWTANQSSRAVLSSVLSKNQSTQIEKLMRALISTSIEGEEDHIITILVDALGEAGFYTTGGPTLHNGEPDSGTKSMISYSHLFVGMILRRGKRKWGVLKEFEFARSIGLPSLLLVEDRVIHPKDLPSGVVAFNRKRPELTAMKIKNRLEVMALPSIEMIPWLYGGNALISVLECIGEDNKVSQLR